MLPFLAPVFLLALLSAAASIPTSPSLAIAAPQRPPPSAASLTSFTVITEGSGCKPGEFSVQLASDNSALTLLFDAFSAASGPNAGPGTRTRAFCRVNIGMSSPGWAFDVSSVDFRGYVYMERGVSASLVSRWKWVDVNGMDMKGKGNVQKKIQGPFEADVLLHKEGEVSGKETSVCQKKDARIQISLSATVDTGTSKANGFIQGDSADAAFGQIVNLSWKKC